MKKDTIISLLEEMKHNAENAHNYEDPKREAKAQALDVALFFVKNVGRDDYLEEYTPGVRKDTLMSALNCVCRDRESQYGTPEDNFRVIASFWNAYLGMDSGITPLDVAMMMALLKIARINTGRQTMDSFVDLAGYAACGAECAVNAKILKENETEIEGA